MHAQSAVDEDDLILLERARLRQSVRIGRRLSEQREYSAIGADFFHFGREVGGQLGLRHADFHRPESGAIRLQRDLIGVAHDLDLVGRLHAATLIGDDRRAAELHSRPRLCQLGEDENACARVDGKATGGESQIFDRIGDEQFRILIFLPHPNVESTTHLILSALLLERR